MEAVKDPDGRRKEFIESAVAEHQTALLRLCYIQLQDKSLAEDAVQETFLKAYRAFDQYRGDCSEKTWLCKIAVTEPPLAGPHERWCGRTGVSHPLLPDLLKSAQK